MSERSEIAAFINAGIAMHKARIKCAVCDKVVDRWRQEHSHESDTIRFTVWCHGEMDTCVLTAQQIMEAKSIEPAYAFTRGRLQPPGRKLPGTLPSSAERSESGGDDREDG